LRLPVMNIAKTLTSFLRCILNIIKWFVAKFIHIIQ
jgi:hypothetical protein